MSRSFTQLNDKNRGKDKLGRMTERYIANYEYEICIRLGDKGLYILQFVLMAQHHSANSIQTVHTQMN